MWYICAMECYSVIKRKSVDGCNMNEPGKHEAKTKKPVTKDHILNASLYIYAQNREF